MVGHMKNKIILLLCIVHSIQGLQTLSDISKQAHKLNEFPINTGSNWLHPNYSKEYKKLAPSFFERMMGKKNPLIKQLGTLLDYFARENQKPQDHVIQLSVTPDTEFIIWGELSGGFHSLVRSLQFLSDQGYLTENLSLAKQNCYFVFNGNSISRGPYNLETLLTILLLMKNNPGRVFYLQGKQERFAHWTNFTMKEELQTRQSLQTTQTIPLKNELSLFFASLPHALYINVTEDADQYIRISPSSRYEGIIDESLIEPRLSKITQNKELVIPLKKEHGLAKTNTSPRLISIIRNEDWIKKHVAKNGLGMLPQEQGATAWAVFSSPIATHQKLLKFEQDAFTIVSIQVPINQSTISLYNHRFDSAQSFQKVSTFNIQTGLSPNDDNMKKSYTIGSSMALVQGVPIMGQRTKQGMTARLREENRAQKTDGINFRYIIKNDNYTPQMTRQNINDFIKKNIDLILLPVGSPTLASYLDYIKESKVLVLFPITGGPQFRNRDLKGLVHFRATYADEVRALVNHLVAESAAKKFALFYQDDAYGKPALEAAHEELKRHNISNWVDVPYQRNSVNFEKQAQIIKEAQPDAIGFFSTAEVTRELIRQIGIDFLTNKLLFGISFLGEESFRRFIKQHGIKVLFGAVVPNPRISNLPIVKEYRAAMDAANAHYDIFSLEGYIATSILLEAIKHITPPITKDKILAKIESFKNHPLKGLTLTFDPNRRDLATHVWIESGDDRDWLKKEITKTPQ